MVRSAPPLLYPPYDLNRQEIALGPDIQAYTLEVIAHGFLGDYATDDVVAEIGRFLPPLLRGMFSFPRSFPWPLNRIPIFGFRRAMDAREGFQRLLEGLIRERRTDLRTNGAKKNGGVVDEFLRMQKEQMDAGGPEEGGVVFDDDFVYDNVSGYAGLTFSCCCRTARFTIFFPFTGVRGLCENSRSRGVSSRSGVDAFVYISISFSSNEEYA